MVQAWDRVFEWDGIHHQWFLGARTNITVNALDCHAKGRRTPTACIWLAEDGASAGCDLWPALRDVCRFANGLSRWE